MALHNEIGEKGENLAVEYLIKEGYQILERNWRFKKSEIDVIAKKGNDLIFIEVKTRSFTHFQAPEESVTLKKQKQIFIGANEYVQSQNDELEVRFDIISVLLKKETQINHIKEAFYPL